MMPVSSAAESQHTELEELDELIDNLSTVRQGVMGKRCIEPYTRKSIHSLLGTALRKLKTARHKLTFVDEPEPVLPADNGEDLEDMDHTTPTQMHLKANGLPYLTPRRVRVPSTDELGRAE